MAERSRPINVGVVGCGTVAWKCHLTALRRLHEVRTVALADPDAERLRRAGERFGVERRHTDYRDLLEDDTVEAVAVLTPTSLHVDVALAALDAGKHVLIEKPLALSLADCDRLSAAAGRCGRVALVGFNTHWHPLVRRARDLARCGTIGRLRMVRVTFSSPQQQAGAVAEWRKRRALGGGCLLDVAVHHFDLWRFLLEREVSQVSAVLTSGEADDELGLVSARMDGGVLASTSFVERTGLAQTVELLGTDGRIEVSCFRFDGLQVFPLSRRSGAAHSRLAAAVNSLVSLPRALLRRTKKGDYGASFLGEWRHFIDCVRRGARPECTLTDGRRALEIAIAAAQSDATGRSVRIADVPDAAPPGRLTPERLALKELRQHLRALSPVRPYLETADARAPDEGQAAAQPPQRQAGLARQLPGRAFEHELHPLVEAEAHHAVPQHGVQRPAAPLGHNGRRAGQPPLAQQDDARRAALAEPVAEVLDVDQRLRPELHALHRPHEVRRSARRRLPRPHAYAQREGQHLPPAVDEGRVLRQQPHALLSEQPER